MSTPAPAHNPWCAFWSEVERLNALADEREARQQAAEAQLPTQEQSAQESGAEDAPEMLSAA